MNKELPISVNICTYNSEKTIGACIRSVLENGPTEVLIIDGASTDKTPEIASSLGVKVIACPEKGLATQRGVGIESSHQAYIAIVDADDILAPDCLKTLLEEMEKGGLDAIAAKVLSAESETYWQRAMSSACLIITEKPRMTNMLGRPALYRTDALKKVGFDTHFNCSEDTDIARRMELAGFTQRQGTGVSYRFHVRTLREVVEKHIAYGRNDALFINKYPDRIGAMLFHLMIRYPLIRGVRAVMKGEGRYYPYYFMAGWIRLSALVVEFVRCAVKGKGIAR